MKAVTDARAKAVACPRPKVPACGIAGPRVPAKASGAIKSLMFEHEDESGEEEEGEESDNGDDPVGDPDAAAGSNDLSDVDVEGLAEKAHKRKKRFSDIWDPDPVGDDGRQESSDGDDDLFATTKTDAGSKTGPNFRERHTAREDATPSKVQSIKGKEKMTDGPNAPKAQGMGASTNAPEARAEDTQPGSTPKKPIAKPTPAKGPTTPPKATTSTVATGDSSAKPDEITFSKPIWKEMPSHRGDEHSDKVAKVNDVWTLVRARTQLQTATDSADPDRNLVAAGTPPPGTYVSWEHPQPRELELHIKMDYKARPYLDGTETLFYNSIANRSNREDFDPPANVHLSDKEVYRLYLLVLSGKRTLEWLAARYPHVFDANGVLWDHRLPQGEPALVWQKATAANAEETFYAVACGHYVLQGEGDHSHSHIAGTKSSQYNEPLTAAAIKSIVAVSHQRYQPQL
jgi:hypothetical protein